MENQKSEEKDKIQRHTEYYPFENSERKYYVKGVTANMRQFQRPRIN